MNLASYQLLQPAMCAAYLHRRAAFKSDKFEYKINYFLEETEDSNPHLTTIRTVSSSCRCASNYTSLLFDFYHEWAILTSFGFSELFHVHQTATFWAVLAPTILRSGVVRLLTWCRTNWIFRMSCVLSPGPGTHWCSPVTSFTRILFLCINMSKNNLPCPLNETLVWRKIVAARTTYFIRYKDLPLRRQRGIQLLNGTKKRVWLRRDSDPSTLVLGKRCSIQLSYSVWLGRKRLNEQTSPQSIYRCR